MRNKKIFSFFVFGLGLYSLSGLVATNFIKVNVENKENFVKGINREDSNASYNIGAISSGNNHSAAIITDGLGNDHLYMWGSNEKGQLGFDSSISNLNKPTEISLESFSKSGQETFVSIENLSLNGDMSSVVLLDSNDKQHLYIWGTFDKPTGEIKNSLYELEETTIDFGYELPLFTDEGEEINNIKTLDMGVNFLGVVTEEETRDSSYLVGLNTNRQLNYEHEGLFYDSFIETEFENIDDQNFNKILDLSLGEGFASFVLDYGDEEHLFLQGYNGNNLITNIPYEISEEITEIDLPNSIIKDVDAGSYSVGVVTIEDDGSEKLYTWGRNDYGQLGLGIEDSNVSVAEKDEVDLGTGNFEINNFNLGQEHALVVTEDESGKSNVLSWGNNDNGQVGKTNVLKDNNSIVKDPFSVKEIDEGSISSLVAGGSTSSVLYTDESGNDLQCGWGDNEFGQLGNGSYESSVEPTFVENTEIIESFSISTEFLEMLSELTFSFLIKTNLEVNPSKIKVYSDKAVEVGYVELVEQENTEYLFEATITESVDTNGIYWSTNGGDTLEEISGSYFSFEVYKPTNNGSNTIILYFVFSVILISIIMFLLYILLKQRKKEFESQGLLEEIITEKASKIDPNEEIEEILRDSEDDINNKLEKMLNTKEIDVRNLSNTREIDLEDFDLEK